MPFFPLLLHRLINDKATGNFRGFGFCRYTEHAAAQAAVEKLNGRYLCGRRIRVDYAEDKQGNKG
jgi:RNA recognition motif-containing protein